MLQAKFYQFAKRDNSTVRPADDAGLSFKIALKENINVDAPDIILYVGRATVPEYNYVFIPDLERYYFIDSWTYIDHANWMASCTIDVLASFKYEIGAQTLYVVRSASRSDGNIPDMLYPATNEVTTQSLVYDSPFNDDGEITISDGCFIVGVDSFDAYYGSVDYYILTGNDMSDLCYWLMNDFVTAAGGFNTTDATIALQRSLVNPMQFIKSCMWLPVSYNDVKSLGVQGNLYVFAYDTGIQSYKLNNTAVYMPNSISLGKLNHPQYDSHGRYVNGAPFTQVSLKLPPFGVLDLDATVINNAGALSLNMFVDLITGKLVAEVKAGVNTLNRVSTQLGVPIQLSQVTRNYLGAVTSAAGALSSVFNMDFLGAVNGIGNAIQNAAPRVNSIGSNGGFADLYGDFELMYTFYRQTEVNNFYHGKPLMKTVQLGTLSGYMEVESADVVIECSNDERTRIVNYLEQGFYYE